MRVLPVAGIGHFQGVPIEKLTAGLARRIVLSVAVLGGVILGCLSLSGMAFGMEAGGCGNESLRVALSSNVLPDCRAYEMVTPPYKEGYPMFVSSLAADGEQAIINGLGNLAGTPGAGESVLQGELYLDRRTTDGWELSPLDAPSSEFVGQLIVAAEANSGLTLWDQHTLGQGYTDQGLYVRSTDGTFSFVGPLKPATSEPEEPSNAMQLNNKGHDTPVAATSDYRHIVLDAADIKGYWPFDLTQSFQGSLYEYSGTNNQQPILVGVTGPKGSTQLVGLCSTRLGGGGVGGFSSAFNALSANGESVFFTVLPGGCAAPTPGTAEVYVRLHGSLSSPLAAETVHVSASECTVSCGGESGKNFEGASEDGKTVYFTSTQKLTNNATDGTASGDATEGTGCAGTTAGMGGCNLYRYDFNAPESERLSLVAGGEVRGVVGMAEDGTRIYFVSQSQLAGANLYGKTPVAEQPNLYVYDAASNETAFIATLDEGDGRDWQREYERPAQVTGEGGRFLLFMSTMEHLTPDDETATNQLFEYDAVTGELVRVSKGEEGYNNNGNNVTSGVVVLPVEAVDNVDDFKSGANPHSISGDGQTVFFLTKAKLSPRAFSAEQGCRSLYEFHAGAGGSLEQGSVRLVSDGRDVNLYKGLLCGAQFQGMDTSGSNVLFTTDDGLVPGDVDSGQLDLYDARVGGGFPVVSGGEGGLCGVGSCEGSVSGPSAVVPGSVSDSGEGAVAPPVVKKAVVKKKKKSVVKRKAGRKKKAKPKGKSLEKGVVRGVVGVGVGVVGGLGGVV
jgi:hypothetical protein